MFKAATNLENKKTFLGQWNYNFQDIHRKEVVIF